MSKVQQIQEDLEIQIQAFENMGIPEKDIHAYYPFMLTSLCVFHSVPEEIFMEWQATEALEQNQIAYC